MGEVRSDVTLSDEEQRVLDLDPFFVDVDSGDTSLSSASSPPSTNRYPHPSPATISSSPPMAISGASPTSPTDRPRRRHRPISAVRC
jgi:hypothetical protein